MKELFVQSNKCTINNEVEGGKKRYTIDFKFSIKDHMTNTMRPMIVTSVFKEGESPTVVVNDQVFG